MLIEIKIVITYGEGTLIVKDYEKLYGVMESSVLNEEGVTRMYIFVKTYQTLRLISESLKVNYTLL